MRTSHLFIAIIWAMLLSHFAIGQNSSNRKKPNWTKGFFYEATYSTIKNFEATGSSEDEALDKVANIVLKYQSDATGNRAHIEKRNGYFEISSIDNLTVKARSIDYFPEKTESYVYRAYLLVQIAKCATCKFDDIKPILKKIEKLQSPFFANKHKSYLGGGLNFGYPNYIGFGFQGRFGGTIGAGGYVGLGADIGNKNNYPFHFSFGLKFFPYRDFFIAGGYGTGGCKKVSFSNPEGGWWNTDGWRKSEGLQFLAGYDLLGDLNNWGGLLSVDAGFSRDKYTGNWSPLINISIGVALGL